MGEKGGVRRTGARRSLNVLVPQSVPAGDLDVLLQIGENTGNTVKLPVQAHAGT